MNRHAVLAGALSLAVGPLCAQTGTAHFRVTDPSGATIPEAKISLLGAKDSPLRSLSTESNGEIVWPYLPAGDSHFRVQMPGFITRQLLVTLRDGDEQKVEVTLQPPPCNYLSDLVAQPPKHPWWQIFH